MWEVVVTAAFFSLIAAVVAVAGIHAIDLYKNGKRRR